MCRAASADDPFSLCALQVLGDVPSGGSGPAQKLKDGACARNYILVHEFRSKH